MRTNSYLVTGEAGPIGSSVVHEFPEELTPLTILNALEGRPIPIYARREIVRDWLFVADRASALPAILVLQSNPVT